MSNQTDFACFRIICDDNTFQNLLNDRQFQASVNKFWAQADRPAETTKLEFSKNFERFQLVQEEAQDRERVVYRNFRPNDEKQLKYALSFGKNSFVKMTLDYVNKELVAATLVDGNGKQTKMKLAKAEKNKNQYSVNFNFLRRPELLLPFVVNGRVVAFFCKYSSADKEAETCYEIHEEEEDIIIPNNHKKILAAIQQLDLRVDFSYFLKGGRKMC